MATSTRARRRKQQRRDPLAAGSDEAIRVVRGWVEQRARVGSGRQEVEAALRARERRDRKRFV